MYRIKGSHQHRKSNYCCRTQESWWSMFCHGSEYSKFSGPLYSQTNCSTAPYIANMAEKSTWLISDSTSQQRLNVWHEAKTVGRWMLLRGSGRIKFWDIVDDVTSIWCRCLHSSPAVLVFQDGKGGRQSIGSDDQRRGVPGYLHT